MISCKCCGKEWIAAAEERVRTELGEMWLPIPGLPPTSKRNTFVAMPSLSIAFDVLIYGSQP